MEHELKRHKAELAELLESPWEWVSLDHYLDGWAINKNRIFQDKFLLEIGKELGPISLPHRHRHFGKL